MDKSGEQSKENDVSYANKLPVEIVGLFLVNLSVGDRLKSERVSPRWSHALSKWGWTEQRKLDADIVFEGANEENIARFWGNLDYECDCQLASLLRGCGPWLSELDLRSFGRKNVGRFLPQIIESFQSLNKIEKLDIRGLNLRVVHHLPYTLRVLKTWRGISIETLKAISRRCPNLEEAPFECIHKKYRLETDSIIALVGKFPRQKKLDLGDSPLWSKKQGALASIGGQLRGLVELEICHCSCFDEESLVAIAGGCQRLRSLDFNTSQLNEKALFRLADFPRLTALEVLDEGKAFTDSVLMAIAKQGNLKKLDVQPYGFCAVSSMPLTDNSIVYLVGRCKSLVSLRFYACPQITERSLEAVVAEVRRRHGTPPRSLPNGPLDNEIFYFRTETSWISPDKARTLVGDNPWLILGKDPRQII